MRPSDDELVRVESEAELHGGLTVWTRPCFSCGKHHARMLVRSVVKDVPCTAHKTRPHHCCSWEIFGGACNGKSRSSCFGLAIAEGRLFRLKPDEQPATHQRQREREDA